MTFVVRNSKDISTKYHASLYREAAIHPLWSHPVCIDFCWCGTSLNKTS